MSHSANPAPLTVEETEIEIPAEVVRRSEQVMLLVPEGWPASGGKPVYAGSTATISKLARQNSLSIEVLDPNLAGHETRENRSADWVAPTIFISSMLMTNHPDAVSVALNVLSNYVTDFFKGRNTDPAVELGIIHQDAKSGKHTRLKYKGPVSGLQTIDAVLRRLHGRK